MPKHPKRPRDPNQLAKLIVDLAAGDVMEDAAPAPSPKAVAGAAGGRKGGPRRAVTLSADERAAIARKAATTRWSKV